MSKPPLPGGRARGFTLVELLVVIGIIALLIGILLPSLSNARRQAAMIKCAAQLKDLGNIMVQYANENHGFVPRDYNYDAQLRGDPGTLGPHIFWAEAFAKYLNVDLPDPGTDGSGRDPILAPYFQKVKIYHCPGAAKVDQVVTYASNSWSVDSDDGKTDLNGNGVGEAQPMINIVRQKHSSEVCFLTEANNNLPNNNFDSYDIKNIDCISYNPANTSNPYNTGTVRMMNDNRHRDEINLLYFDSHVISKKWKEVTKHDFRYIEDDPRFKGP